MKKWFRAKRYGLGWVPATIEGLTVLLVYIAICVFIFVKVFSKSYSENDVIFKFVLPYIFLTIILMIICYKKGEELRFRWGDKDGTDKK